MPTLRQIIYNFRNTLSGGKPTRDRGYSDRQIAYIARICRNLLLNNDIMRTTNQEVAVSYEQDFGCVPLATVDQADCIQKEWGDDVRKVILPPLFALPDNAGLTFFGLIDKRTRIYIPSLQYGNLDDHVPFKKKNDIKGYQIDRKIYVYGPGAENLCYVNIRGIPVDPTLTEIYDSSITPRCFDWDVDSYPIPAHLEQAMYSMMNKEYVDIMAKAPEDVKNDELKEAVA